MLNRPGDTVSFVLRNGLPATAFQVALRRLADNVVVVPATTAGVVEQDPGGASSNYTGTLTIPTGATAGEYQGEFVGPDGTIYPDARLVQVVTDPTIVIPGGTTGGGYVDNRPQLDRLKRQLTQFPDLPDYSDVTLQEQLDASIAWIEDEATTKFNGLQVVELYDGNSTNQIVVRKRPVTSIILLTVETPILGFIRTYDQTELKVYRKQGVTKVFTYKLAVEQALFNTLDYQAWGTIFPPLPQCIHVTYTYGYPQFNPTLNETTLDGGTTVLAGDQRDPEESNWLTNLQEAAVCDAAAAILAGAGAKVGIVQSMSFDGYARTLNAGAYQAQVQFLVGRRDERLGKRKRRFYMSTIG